MDKEDFLALCEEATKDGPILAWEIAKLRENTNLRHRYLAIQVPRQKNKWKVYWCDMRSKVEFLGKFHGATPLELYNAVPRKVFA